MSLYYYITIDGQEYGCPAFARNMDKNELHLIDSLGNIYHTIKVKKWSTMIVKKETLLKRLKKTFGGK